MGFYLRPKSSFLFLWYFFPSTLGFNIWVISWIKLLEIVLCSISLSNKFQVNIQIQQNITVAKKLCNFSLILCFIAAMPMLLILSIFIWYALLNKFRHNFYLKLIHIFTTFSVRILEWLCCYKISTITTFYNFYHFNTKSSLVFNVLTWSVFAWNLFPNLLYFFFMKNSNSCSLFSLNNNEKQNI